MDVGPSAAPMMPMDAASFRSKPKRRARPMVRKIPAWAVIPKIKVTGFWNRGVKSIMAPMAMNISRGNISLAMPASKRMLRAPCWRWSPAICVRADENGMFTSSVPNPMGSSRDGSYSFAMAR